jgi:hypothetical protein
MTQGQIKQVINFIGSLVSIIAVVFIIALILNPILPDGIEIGIPPLVQFVLIGFAFKFVSGLIYTAWNRYRNNNPSGAYTPELREPHKRLAQDEAIVDNSNEYDAVYEPSKRKLSEEE